MFLIMASVGEGGDNKPIDVRMVQAALNKSGVILGPLMIPEHGMCDDMTISGIKTFQQKFLTPMIATGLIKPADATHKTLDLVAYPPKVEAAANLSGKDWWHANQAKYPNTAAVSELDPGFKTKVEKFLAALKAANASVSIAATRRNANRAWLMHWSFKLSKGQVKAKDIKANPEVDIDWTHDDEKASRKAAKEMVDLFSIVYQPSLTSLHIKGLAIDMNISWAGTLKIVDGKGVTREIGTPLTGSANTDLHKVGATYGVHKLLSDKPHWSSNGH